MTFLFRKVDDALQNELPVEVVERKGFGHPDTICDQIAELSGACLYDRYQELFSEALHYNVDKILLRGGRAAPRFGGGRLLEPIGIYLAGRATSSFRGTAIPVSDLLIRATRCWFRENFSLLDPERDLQIECLVRPGSESLTDLFRRDKAPRSNDTSIGVGFAPLSKLERLVFDVERWMNSTRFRLEHPELGRDVKIMGIREGTSYRLLIAAAMVDRHISDISDYSRKTLSLSELVKRFASEHVGVPVDISWNAADDPTRNSIYLTVTGLSAEAGDDGEVGRGNRFNGLITPLRPMTLEAYAGKNSVCHTGRLYQSCAQKIAERICSEIDSVAEARCLLVSRIGALISEPEITEIQYKKKSFSGSEVPKNLVQSIVHAELQALYLHPSLQERKTL